MTPEEAFAFVQDQLVPRFARQYFWLDPDDLESESMLALAETIVFHPTEVNRAYIFRACANRCVSLSRARGNRTSTGGMRASFVSIEALAEDTGVAAFAIADPYANQDARTDLAIAVAVLRRVGRVPRRTLDCCLSEQRDTELARRWRISKARVCQIRRDGREAVAMALAG